MSWTTSALLPFSTPYRHLSFHPALFPVKMPTSRSMSRPVTGGESTFLGAILSASLDHPPSYQSLSVFRFSGSSGQAIVSRNSAYLVTDSRYWLQAQEQLDPNWILVRAGSMNAPKDWIEWLVVRATWLAIFGPLLNKS